MISIAREFFGPILLDNREPSVPLVMIIDYFIGAKRRCIWATSVLDTEYSRPKKNYIEIILWLVVLFFLTALCMWNVLIKVSVQIYWHHLNSRDLLNFRIRAYSTPAVYKNLRVLWWSFIEIFWIFAPKSLKKWTFEAKKWRFIQIWL